MKRLPIFLLASLLVTASGWAGSTIYLAPGACAECADGTEAHPYPTLENGKNAARALIAAGQAADIVLAGGTYQLIEPLELGAADSGTPGHPVTWRAAAGQSAHVCGGIPLSGWQPVADPAILRRLDLSVAGRVVQVDLRKNGVTDFGELKPGGWTRAGGPSLELYVDDKPMRLARYPNEGFIPVAEALGTTPAIDRGKPLSDTKVEGIIRIDDRRIARWAAEDDAWVLGYWHFDWAYDRERVQSIDPRRLILTLARPWHGSGYKAGASGRPGYFYGYNLLCELDQPGEWYLSRKTGALYLLPPGGGVPQRSYVTLSTGLLSIAHAADIEFKDILFEGCRGTAIDIQSSNDCVVSGCTIRNAGERGIGISGGHACIVDRCDIYATGNAGVHISGGDRATLSRADHVVENCSIHDYARWGRTYEPGVGITGAGCSVLHNHIYNAPHEAIAFNGNDHVMQWNDIHDVCAESNDAGAIYSGADWAARGNLIADNYIHHVTGYKDRGANGVYLDDDFSSATVEGNIFEQVPRALMLGGGRDNHIANNVVIDCDPPLSMDARGLGWRAYGYAGLRARLEKLPYQRPPWSTRYPELVHILDEDPMAPRGVTIASNLFIGCPPVQRGVSKQALPYFAPRNNLEAPNDPQLYTRTASGIPIVNMDAPGVRQTGFRPIPVDQIGITRGGTKDR